MLLLTEDLCADDQRGVICWGTELRRVQRLSEQLDVARHVHGVRCRWVRESLESCSGHTAVSLGVAWQVSGYTPLESYAPRYMTVSDGEWLFAFTFKAPPEV